MEAITAKICTKIFRHLRKRGIISDSDEWLDLPEDLFAQDNQFYATAQKTSAMDYIGIGKNRGQRIRKIGKSMSWEGEPSFFESPLFLYQNSFTLHAERSLKAEQRTQLEDLLRYTACSPLCDQPEIGYMRGKLAYTACPS